jgi:hypothetical protein
MFLVKPTYLTFCIHIKREKEENLYTLCFLRNHRCEKVCEVQTYNCFCAERKVVRGWKA